MIIKENITLYKCEYCGKALFRRKMMEKHEDLCNNNPKNFKACMDCKFLEKVQVDVHWLDGHPDYNANERKVEAFKCNKLDKLMFPFSIERKKLHEKYDTYADQERMPNACPSKEQREDIY